ncbi:MAG: MAPEG family protein [Tagaea sp.]|nr:MAPEG family protein [Tagaea sp.]
MTTLAITTFYALLLSLILLALFVNVARRRAALSRSIGDGGDVELHERIRRHGNFVEWTPMVLILLALAELQQGPAIALHAAGILLVAGRVLHPFGLHADRPGHPLRIAGNMGAIFAILVLAGVLGISLIEP